jgi:hypothetical protein
MTLAVEPTHDAKQRAYIELLVAEKKRRLLATPLSQSLAWARSFAGRPREFIREIMGEEWDRPGWVAWRAYVAAIFDQPMTDEEYLVYQECTGREDPPVGRQYEVWAPVGRRGGKSRMMALIAVYLAVCYDYSDYLAPGEPGFIAVLSDRRDHATGIMRYAVAALRAHPKLALLIERPLTETLELANGIIIEVTTASIAAVRSRTVIAALCDEIAFWPNEEGSANPDEEILNGLRPAMATIPDALLLAAGSPYARRGAMWNAYNDYFGKASGPLIWQAPTRRMNPQVPQAYLDREYEKDPISAAAEYGAEFRVDVAAYLTREAIMACVDVGVREREPILGMRYRAFVDPSGGGVDSMTLAIAHRDVEGRGVLDVLREHRPPLNLDAVTAEFCFILKTYGVTSVEGDHYAGEWPRERFAAPKTSDDTYKPQVTYKTSEKNKSDIYREWLPLVNTRRVVLLDEPRMINQAAVLERKTSRLGKDSIDHPKGGHDDVVNVAAGVLVAVAEHRPIVVSREALVRSRIGPQMLPGQVAPYVTQNPAPRRISTAALERSRMGGR